MYKEKIKEVKSNSKIFQSLLPDLLQKQLEGKYALMHNGKIESVLDDFDDAVVMGYKLYGDKPFSVQPIVSEPVNLGAYPYFR